MIEIKKATYEDARLKHFIKQRESAERRINYWSSPKQVKRVGWKEAHERASDAGWECNFYDDAIKALGSQDDFFGAVLNCAVRYCLGRASYMPGLVIDYITPMLPRLSKKTLWCFEKDIESCENYGMDMDKEKWMEFLAKVKKAIAEVEG